MEVGELEHALLRRTRCDGRQEMICFDKTHFRGGSHPQFCISALLFACFLELCDLFGVPTMGQCHAPETSKTAANNPLQPKQQIQPQVLLTTYSSTKETQTSKQAEIPEVVLLGFQGLSTFSKGVWSCRGTISNPNEHPLTDPPRGRTGAQPSAS